MPATLLTLLVLFAPPGPTRGCLILVNDANPVYAATVEQVADLFLGRRTDWRTGHPVLPVDQSPDAPVREEFSVAVLGRPLQAVQAYWRRKLYTGEAVPPPELTSDQAVVDFIRTHPDAIGYVSSDAPLGAGVHAIAVTR